MLSTSITSFALLASSAFALPATKRDLSVDQAAQLATGGPPNGGAPTGISATAIAGFQAVNFLENLESAFFEQGLANLTYWNRAGELDAAIEVVTKVHAQELIHVATAEGILKANNASTFARCQYTFPVSNAEEFLALANIITSVGIGGVINLIAGLAVSDARLVQGPASILSAEARHDAFFRQAALGLVPTPSPFDTRVSAPLVLSFDNQFVVPGSCGAANAPKFTPIPSLVAEPVLPNHTHHNYRWYQSPATGTNTAIHFRFDAAEVQKSNTTSGLFIGWINQANKIAYTPAQKVAGQNGLVETVIPDGLAGMAFAVLTGQNAALDVNALTPLTLAGPAPVQIS
ncbi:MAG: hypothetical protein Q9191_007789 [Dirinaria sp. TL-2023a]